RRARSGCAPSSLGPTVTPGIAGHGVDATGPPPSAADAPGLRNAHDAALLRPGPPPAFRPGRGRPPGARHGAGAEGGPGCPGPAATLLRLPVRLRARHGWLKLPVAGGDGRWFARELRLPVHQDAEQVSVGGQYLAVAAELALLA